MMGNLILRASSSLSLSAPVHLLFVAYVRGAAASLRLYGTLNPVVCVCCRHKRRPDQTRPDQRPEHFMVFHSFLPASLSSSAAAHFFFLERTRAVLLYCTLEILSRFDFDGHQSALATGCDGRKEFLVNGSLAINHLCRKIKIK